MDPSIFHANQLIPKDILTCVRFCNYQNALRFCIYQIAYIKSIINTCQTLTFGGPMDPEHLLTTLSIAFDTSNHKQSEILIQKIIHLAAQKFNPSKISKSPLTLKSQQSMHFLRRLLNKETQKPKIKFISKSKLRRIAIRRIANKNKKVHEQFIKATHQKQFKIDRRITQTSNISIFQAEKEEHKLQSAEQEDEKFVLYPQNHESPKVACQEKEEIGGNKATISKQLITKKFKKTRKNFQNYLISDSTESKAEEITCPVCIQILIDPVSTICGHSFCFKCLDESLLFGSNCPVCRLFIKGTEIIPCKYLKDFIKAKLSQFLEDQSAMQTYRLRKKQNDEWKQSRFVDPLNLRLGDIIDVRDTENIWCKATILKIYCIDKRISSILVHYQQWAKIYDEVIEIKSNRLAPRQFFSSRTDIPRYNLGNGEQNLRGAVITGNNNEVPLRNQGNELVFSNIMQLNNLRSRFSALQNNVINELIPVSILPRNRQVGFLHHVIEPGSDEQSHDQEGDLIFNQFSSGGMDEGNESSIGSFVFGQNPIALDESESDSLENGLEIGQPVEDYISIHDSSEQRNNWENDGSEEYLNARPFIELNQMDEEYQERQNSDDFSSVPSSIRFTRLQYSQNLVDADQYSYENSNSY